MFSFIIFISPSINHHLNEDIWCQKTYLPCRAKFASPEVYSVGGISISITYRRKWAAPGCRARPPPHRALSDSIVSLSARPAMSCQCHSINSFLQGSQKSRASCQLPAMLMKTTDSWDCPPGAVVREVPQEPSLLTDSWGDSYVQAKAWDPPG